jgi:hypothetical protein
MRDMLVGEFENLVFGAASDFAILRVQFDEPTGR